MNQFVRTLKPFARICLVAAGLALLAAPAFADSYSDTISLFKEAGASAGFFNQVTGMPYSRQSAREGSSSAGRMGREGYIDTAVTSAIRR